MAPSTPPPPSRVEFAAFTIASTSSVVMSPRTTSIQLSRFFFMNGPLNNDEARMTNAERITNVQMVERPTILPVAIRISSLDIRHSFIEAFMVQGDQSTTIHSLAACNENDRATDSGAPAKIPLSRV